MIIPFSVGGTASIDMDYSTSFTSLGATSTAAGCSGSNCYEDGEFGSDNNELHNPKDVFVDSVGNIYIAEDSNHRITKWNLGATSGIVVAGGNGYGSGLNEFRDPYAVHVDLSGNVYVADRENNRIMKWAPNSNEGVVVAGGNGEGNAKFYFTLCQPDSRWHYDIGNFNSECRCKRVAR